MKRLSMILLLALLPLQAAWAAPCACCAEASEQGGEQPPAAGQDQQPARPHQDEAERRSAGALPSVHPDLPLPKGAPHLRGGLRRYV